MVEKLFYSWQEYDKDILLLNSRIHVSSWFPDYIVGIKRGGLIPAVSLSHLFKIPMNIINFQLRDGDGCELSDLLELPKDSRILLVDDICDTGETFRAIKEEIKQNYLNIKFCSLFYNIRQNITVDYFARRIDREKDTSWIVFPWEF
jgi:hypoxanthine phosphoribosyltransferase